MCLCAGIHVSARIHITYSHTVSVYARHNRIGKGELRDNTKGRGS